MKTAEEYYLQAIKELGFEGYKHSEMSNSDLHMCTITAMKLYANQKLDEASGKATLKIERNGKRIFKGNYAFIAEDGDHIEIDKQSILSLKDKV